MAYCISFKPIVKASNRRKDGTYPVRIRVTFKGVSRVLPTTMVANANDLTRSLKIKSGTILNKSEELIGRMRNAVKDISPFDLENWDVDRVINHIKDSLMEESFSLDFFEWAERYLPSKGDKTREIYDQALNAFARFLGERRVDINSISRSMLLDFVDFVDNEPKMHTNPHTGECVPCKFTKIPKGASSRHLMKLQHIFNAAKHRYNDEDTGHILIPRSPFTTIAKVFPVANGQKNLGMELMQRIISAQVSDSAERIALDAFVVSFGLMGANMADLYNAVPFTGQWVYNRQKTATRRADRAEMRVDIPAQLQPFIDRLRASRSPWWLPQLHKMGSTKDICTSKVNGALSRWCKENDIPVFTFYAARHTWSSIARNVAKIEKATIDDCLVHKGSFNMADIYIEKDFGIMNEANAKVLDLFEW